MCRLVICLLLLLFLTNCYPLYNLYNRLTQYQNPLNIDFGQPKIVLPEESNMIITIQISQPLNQLVRFFRINGQVQQVHYNFFYKKIGQFLIDAFWIDNQYLLIIGKEWKLFYRPPFNNFSQYSAYAPSNFSILDGFVRKNKNGKTQLTTISYNATDRQLLLRKQALTYNSSLILRNISLCKINTANEVFRKIIKLKDFQCALLSAFTVTRQKTFYVKFSCYHLDSEKVITNQIQQDGISFANATFNQTANTVYCVRQSQLIRYELSLRNNDLYIDKKYILNKTQKLATLVQQNISIEKSQIVLHSIRLYGCKHCLAMISVEYPQRPFYFQLFGPQLSNIDSFIFIAREKDIFFIPKDRQINWILLFRADNQLPFLFIIVNIAIYGMIILIVTFKSAANYRIYYQILKIEQRLKATLFQLALTLVVLPAATLLQVLSTDTTNSTNFIPCTPRLVSLQSYNLKVFTLLFLFTSLVYTIFQTYAQYRSKSSYLNVLVKHGLPFQRYFFVKQHLIVMKALLYSTLSTYFLVFLDSSFSDEQFQLYPTTEQIIAVSVAYFTCFYTVYNMSLFLVQYCDKYWMSMCALLSITFLIVFSSGEFYLNNTIFDEQLILSVISPHALFSTIIQQIFKTEVRFNEETTAYFLFGVHSTQTIVILMLYTLFISRHYKKTQFSSIKQKNRKQINQAINESQVTASENNIQNSLIYNSISNNVLLDVFIPSKLSKNQGFEKINLLKNIRFTANKGEIVTFVDSINLSKAMLFKILINDQKSDSHLEKDLVGSIDFFMPVTISFCFENRSYFQELTVYQHIELFSVLKNPKMSRQGRKKQIEFMLNQFNIPDEFRVMKPSELSGGYLKKMSLACTFIGEPDVVIIDQPSHGLDNRFRGLLYQKLREWKQNKLIIIGTSDTFEAEHISDKIRTLQKSKIVDKNSCGQKRYITLINLYFSQEIDISQAQIAARAILMEMQTNLTSILNVTKNNYILRIQIYHRQDHSYYQNLNKLMVELSQIFGFASDRCLIDLSIVEHPYNESTFASLKTMKNQMISLNQMNNYLRNNVFNGNSEDEEEELLKTRENDKINLKVIRLLESLSLVEKKQHLLFSQFQAIIYKQYRLWKNNRLYLQVLVASVYSTVQHLLWQKINRDIQYYDFVNMLIIFCFLHTSIFSIKENSSLRNKSKKIYIIGGNPLIVTIANLAFNFLYLLISFVSNLLLQTFIIKFVSMSDIDSHIFEILLSGVFYILNYTLYAALISRIVNRVDFIFAIIILTQLCLIGINFNSFIISYNTYYFNIFQVIKYFYFPLTTMSFYFDQEILTYIFYLLASTVLILFIIIASQHFFSKKIDRNRRIPNYKNIHNKSIDAERVFIENIEDRSKVPLICQNIIHKYSKQVVVKNFSCHINEGEIFGLLGHNGCGKTTIFNIVAGAVTQSSGIVEQFGQEKGKIGYLERLNRGYCPQSGSLEEELTVEQNIRFVGMIKGLTSNYITKFMLLFLKYFRLKGIEQVKAKYLSQAEKKKISFIIAFLGFPKLLYFDEITSGVEQESRKRMLELMRAYCDEYNASIFFSTHNIHQAEGYCDRVSIMKDGVMKNAGEPMKLRVSKYHQFYLLQLSMNKNQENLILQKKKSKVKQYIYSLAFIRIQFEGNFRLIYSLDMMKVNILSVWNRVFFEFYKKGIIEKFTLKRHGLEEVVKESLVQQQNRQSLIIESQLD